MIFDAQYTMLENIEKEDWGHSNAFRGIDIALAADVKRLALTHHDPAYRDEKLWSILNEAKEYLDSHPSKNGLQLFLAYEGLTLSL